MHVEVSSELSALLAGIILKSGFVGILKFLLIFLMLVSHVLSTVIIIFIIIGLFAVMINLLLITDYKKIIGS